jgi:hypothetical protein
MPRRRSWLDRINPANWLKNLIPTPKTERRRGSREFGRGQKRQAQPINPNAPRFGARQGFGAAQQFGPEPSAGMDDETARDIWSDAGGQGSYARARTFFDNLNVPYESKEEEEEVWEAFATYMTHDSGYRYNSVGNPFWSSIGMTPDNPRFNWDEWRAAVWAGRHHS